MPKGLGKAFENAITGNHEEPERKGAIGSHTREKVFMFLTVRPFSTKAVLSEVLGVSGKTVSWHLTKLMENGFVASKDKMYYPTGFVAPEDMALLAFFSKKDTRGFYSLISKRPGISIGDIAEELGMANSRASAMANNLEDVGTLSRVKDGRSTRLYPNRLVENKKRDYNALSKRFISHLSKLLQQGGDVFEVERTGEIFTVVLEEGGEKRRLSFNTNPFVTILQEELPPLF